MSLVRSLFCCCYPTPRHPRSDPQPSSPRLIPFRTDQHTDEKHPEYLTTSELLDTTIIPPPPYTPCPLSDTAPPVCEGYTLAPPPAAYLSPYHSQPTINYASPQDGRRSASPYSSRPSSIVSTPSTRITGVTTTYTGSTRERRYSASLRAPWGSESVRALASQQDTESLRAESTEDSQSIRTPREDVLPPSYLSSLRPQDVHLVEGERHPVEEEGWLAWLTAIADVDVAEVAARMRESTRARSASREEQDYRVGRCQGKDPWIG